MKLHVALDLQTLKCSAEKENGSEPYIWPIMIGDENGVQRLHVPTSQWEVLPLASEMTAGQSVSIPQGMDMDLGHVFENKDTGLLVFVIMLFEQDVTPKHAIVSVLRHIEERALQLVKEQADVFRQSSGERLDLRETLRLRLDMTKVLNDAINWAESLHMYVSGADHPIGMSVWALSGAALKQRPIDFDLRSNTEQFTLGANLKVSVVLPSRCQAQQDAVVHAQAVVDGLHSQRAALQQMLHHATSQQKPGIIANITRIAEVDLPAAEAALAQAQAALDSCLATFGGPGSPLGDNPVIG